MAEPLQVVQAQKTAMDKKAKSATVKRGFDNAIASSKRAGLTQLAALANELAGKYFLLIDRHEAAYYFATARSLYREWGATAKDDHIRRTYEELLFDVCVESPMHADGGSQSVANNSSFRGRRRYSYIHASKHRDYDPIRDSTTSVEPHRSQTSSAAF